MKTAIQRRASRQLAQLIEGGSAYHVARMAVCAQGVGAVGLDLPHASTRFTLRFSAGNKGFGSNARDLEAGVNCYVDAPCLEISEDESASIALVRRLEDLVSMPEEDRWKNDDEDFFPDQAIAALMEDFPVVNRVVRNELLQNLAAAWLLERIEIDITATINEYR